jgi:hypothetical protein
MIKRILKYWPEFIIFGVIFGVFLNAASPNLSWFNMAVDGTAYVMSAQYLYPAHKTSAPLYLLTGHFFMMPQIGTDYWRLAIMSSVFALGCLIFTYLIVRQLLKDNPKNRLYALIAVLVFGSSMMLISQAVVVVPFTMVTMFSLAAFYFALKKKWAWVAIMLGCGLATHHLILITWVVLILFFKEMRNWKRILITLAFVLFYLYIPLSKMFSDQPDMWLNTDIKGFLQDNIFTLSGLAGGVAIWDLPKRIFELMGFWGVCFTIGLIPLAWFVWKQKYWKNPLFWLFFLPWIYAETSLDPHVSRYALAGVGFGAVIIALALTKLKMRWVGAVGLSSIIMLGYNGWFFDFGKNIDPNLTATKFYNEEYPKVKDGQIFINMLPGGEWEMTFYYNKKEGRHIIPICMGMLPNPAYQEQLKAQGVKLLSSDLKNGTDAEVAIAQSIVELNPDVLVTKPTNIYDYGATLVPAKDNMNEITQWAGYEVKTDWHFKPSNPYDILTGKLELSQWKWTLQSTWDFKFFFVLFIIWLVGKWFMAGMPRKKKDEVIIEPKSSKNH